MIEVLWTCQTCGCIGSVDAGKRRPMPTAEWLQLLGRQVRADHLRQRLDCTGAPDVISFAVPANEVLWKPVVEVRSCR